MLNPEIKKSLQIDEHDASLLLAPSLVLRVARKPTGGDEEAHVPLTKESEQRPHAIYGRLVATTFHLNLDPRSLNAEWVRVCDDVDALIGPGGDTHATWYPIARRRPATSS